MNRLGKSLLQTLRGGLLNRLGNHRRPSSVGDISLVFARVCVVNLRFKDAEISVKALENFIRN